jgi:predicted ATP-grasp superfamily ATP-dependent carboligase
VWHRAPAPGSPGYGARLLEVARSLMPVSLVMVGNGAVAAADRLRDRWPEDVRIALPPRESLGIANDKVKTATLARSLGIRTPRERVIADAGAARRAFSEFGKPLVLKSAQEEGRKVLRYVRSEAEVERGFQDVAARSSGAVLAQEFIAGDGYGFSALYWNGRLVRRFMHRRVREWPPSGGASTCAESVLDAPDLAWAGTTLLDALRWHGVAMVEFKGVPRRDTLSLREINAKFWGSHDLALAAGVDFPGDLVALLEGRTLAAQPSYRAIRMSWPLGGDLWHGLFRPTSLPAVMRDALSPSVAHTWRGDDPAPGWRELVQWMRSTLGAWREYRSTQR